MHPKRHELELYALNGLDSSRRTELTSHLEKCQFCREIIDDFQAYLASVDDVSADDMPLKAHALADKIFNQSIAGRVIEMNLISSDRNSGKHILAADGKQKDNNSTSDIVGLATLVSEDPDLVLKIMHDKNSDQDYIQLIADDPAFYSNVLVQSPDIQDGFITDQDGRAVIERGTVDHPEKHAWQIKMPDAVFKLEPLEYDPDKTEFSKEVVLETDKSDKIKVIFHRKSGHKQIDINILELDGQTEFDNIRICINQQNSSDTGFIKHGDSVCFDLVDSDSQIDIRLFN